MKKIIAILIILLFQKSLCAEFGEYRYTKYLGIQQQLQQRKMMALRQQRLRHQSPTRNIRYPSTGNPYPNIQRTPSRPYSARQRYSAQYYSRYY